MQLLSSQQIEELIHRISLLQAGSKGRWGKMTVEQMMIHCSAGIKMALGDLPVKVKTSALRATIARVLFVDLLPFPRSAPTAAELNVHKKLKQVLSFGEAQKELIDQVRRVGAIPENFQFIIHPVFHQLSRRQWGKLAYKHLDHHLKQFGV